MYKPIAYLHTYSLIPGEIQRLSKSDQPDPFYVEAWLGCFSLYVRRSIKSNFKMLTSADIHQPT